MNISKICIERPVFATVLSLILIVIGFIGFHYLDESFLPKFEQNSIIITTFYPGASAQLVENNITTPLEEAVSGIEGIDVLQSNSTQGMSTMTITLRDEVNAYEIANKIRNKVAVAVNNLPSNIKSPDVQVGRGSMDLMDIGFISNNLSLQDLRDYLERFVINRIQEIPGVADVEINGANKYAMRISLDPKKMSARRIGVSEIIDAIKNNNVELPAGKIKGNSIDYPLTADTQLMSPQQFENIIIKQLDNQTIRLKDVAMVELGSDQNNESLVTINGHRGVLLTVYNGSDANPIATANAISQLLTNIKSQLPPGTQSIMCYNQADYMKASIHEVYVAIIFSILCVVAIILLFLGQWRTLLIPFATIPICLMTTFGILYFFDLSINVISLLAIVLSIGLVVDDAIVMLENIYRHIEKGVKPFAAAIKGSHEITFAVIAMTLTLAAVYAPIGLVKGQAANLFRSFAFPLGGSVIVSGFIALTLSPMMCSRLLSFHSFHKKNYSYFLNKVFERTTHFYRQLLTKILNLKWLIVILAFLIAAGGFFLFTSVSKAFMPPEDMGFVLTVIHSPNGANVNYTENQINKITNILQKYPSVQNILAIASDQSQDFNMIFTLLKPYQERKTSAFTLADVVNKEIQKDPTLYASTFAPSFGGSMQHQLEFYIMNSGSYLDLYHISQFLVDVLKKYPGLSDIRTDMNFDSQQYKLTVNRDLAAKSKVTISQVDNTLANLLGGNAISTFNMNGRDYDVYLQAQEDYLHSLNSISELYLKNTNGELIPLGNLISITPSLSQPTLAHYDRLRAAQITTQLAPNYKLGEAVSYLQKKLPELLPANTKYAFTGTAKQMLDSNSSMGIIFLLALIFIYLVLSAQFESFLDPLIILLAVPLSIVGALFSLKLIDGSINIYTMIGLVTLIGLVSKHGILITQFANKLQAEGKSLNDALLEAASIRLRPILMTTAAMIFGALPLVFTTGASAASRQQIGAVIIGGLFFGTFFSLILVPVTYSYAAKLKITTKKLLRKFSK